MKTMPIYLLCLFAVIVPAWTQSPELKITRTPEGFLVTEAAKNILFYQQTPRSLDGKFTRNHYIHPLYGLAGDTLTEDFPADHLHHRGIFWAWHQVWIGDKRIGDGWVLQDFGWDVHNVDIRQQKDGSVALVLQVHWMSPLWQDARGNQKPFVQETSAIRIYPVTAAGRVIDFEIALRALEDNVRIGGSEDQKGYGGFSARLKLPEDIEFIGPDSAVTPITNQVTAGPWLDLVGTFQKNNGKSGLAILCHPTSPNHPQPWILRRTGSTQNVVYPGSAPVPLSTTRPVILRYRMLIHPMELTTPDIARQFQRYAQLKDFILN